MARTYLPVNDGPLADWAEVFTAGITAGLETFGLTIEQVAAYSALKDDYVTKLAASINPATRGTATVLAKNTSKKTLIAESRKLAMAVTNFSGVTDQERHDLGLTVKDVEPTPVPVPETSPEFDGVKAEGWTVRFRLHNGDSTRRAKPEGVKGANVFSYVGETPPAEIADWKFEGGITKTDSSVTFPSTLAAGTKIWLTAFWFNTKAESGPAAVPVSTQINYGGLSMAA